MIKTSHKNAQAATELAVFGAILIFLLGAIVRSAFSNSTTQNENLRTMRMAMLNSWNSSKASSTSRSNASVLIVEDRLTPDFTKYGNLDRNPYIANGSGSFTYEMLYPLDPTEVVTNLPIMDIYINGQQFPFTTASYVAGKTLLQTTQACAGGPYVTLPYTQQQCWANQCLRYEREWVPDPGNPNIKYKLFYTHVVNAVPGGGAGGGPTLFTLTPPNCPNPNSTGCKDKALSSTLVLGGHPNANADLMFDLQRYGVYNATDPSFVTSASGLRPYIAWQWSATMASVQGNTNGGADPMIGLDPNNNQYPSYDIDGRLKEVTIYAITVDTTTGSPTAGDPTVSYEDFQGGDIDSTWDSNSCTPKPGLQNDSEIFTFTKNGTYLQIKEGQLYNPETGQVVRSLNLRNSIDLIQRTIQLSNNTGRFCNGDNLCSCPAPPAPCPCANPNPVEACVSGNAGDNCFNLGNIAKTCYDTGNNMIYVRSRVEDQRGNYWKTNASGHLGIK